MKQFVRGRFTRPLMCLISASLAGCQTYQARPLDMDDMVASWRSRAASDQAVQATAARRGTAFDASDGLNADEGVAVALTFNPHLNSLERAAAVAGAGLADVAPLPNPQLELQARRVLDSGPDGWRIEGGLAFVIPLSDRIGAERDRARAVVRAEAASLSAARWALANKVRGAWLRWSEAASEVGVWQQYARTMKPLEEAARSLSAAGELDSTRLGVLELDRLEAQAAQQDAAGRADTLAMALRQLMGIRPDAPVTLLPSLEPPANAERADGAPVVSHPEVLAARATYSASEHAVRLEIARQYPDLRIGPSASVEGPGALGLGIGLPIPSLDLNRRPIAQSRARRLARQASVRLVVEQLLAGAALARANAARFRARLVRTRQTLLPAVDKQLDRLAQLAADGEIDPLLVRHVLERARQIRLAELKSQALLALALNDLAATTLAPGVLHENGVPHE
jgi:cobalt-zinc-cadmium efflux system outer membrane protein